MKRYYGSTDYERQRITLNRVEELDDMMEKVDYEASYTVSDCGQSLIRIFFYPIFAEDHKQFTQQETRELIKLLNQWFNITNKGSLKPETSREDYHRWTREFREDVGEFHMCRYLEKHWTDPNCDLYLMLEDAPMLNCKLVQKRRMQKYYIADCTGE